MQQSLQKKKKKIKKGIPNRLSKNKEPVKRIQRANTYLLNPFECHVLLNKENTKILFFLLNYY